MRYVTLVARILFGLAFTVFGLNGVLMSVFGKAFKCRRQRRCRRLQLPSFRR